MEDYEQKIEELLKELVEPFVMPSADKATRLKMLAAYLIGKNERLEHINQMLSDEVRSKERSLAGANEEIKQLYASLDGYEGLLQMSKRIAQENFEQSCRNRTDK